jgi:hypothetical protein
LSDGTLTFYNVPAPWNSLKSMNLLMKAGNHTKS